MTDQEWMASLPGMTDTQLAGEVGRFSTWADGYYGRLVDALANEVEKRLRATGGIFTTQEIRAMAHAVETLPRWRELCGELVRRRELASDAAAVYAALDDQAKHRTGRENVEDTLAAMRRLAVGMYSPLQGIPEHQVQREP